ncbi:replication-associated recombination protein A [Mycoplasmopsis caviae]|uniref:ATPase n=1 Tax=Mycoplasmopsis caviae TaxID=55603 RepID=A0A3P8LI61_9BACT|nr:replication-associated recombination protein A [Mycoplasmopsis caviae]UUD35147.1 replication-associated recombination protein A [Mycoplasmopsis caviae]VDR42042.1 ATPase [Mycoplasmopsis caviae]
MKNLANEIRPKKLDDIVGQKNVVTLLKEIVKNNATTSFIFFGESGTGKSSAAFALANDLKLRNGYFNATINNKNDLIKIIESNDIIIIDEIHRLNKDKQDILLSYLEFDKIIVYATTTENPYFRINPALRSRMQILQFTKLSEEDIMIGLKKIINTYYPKFKIKDNILKILIKNSAGDYRSCINNLQILTLLNKDKEVNEEDLKTLIPNINFYSDRESSAHYNNLSAFHKSLRGSDVDAALYYGALILKTGDYLGLFRRLTAATYEDVGLADPNLPMRVEAAFSAVERLGFPEAYLPLYYIIISVAIAPKSNSVYKAISKVEPFIDQGNIYEIPKHLKDAHYKSAQKLGDGLGYKYPHDFPNHWVKQDYMPKNIADKKFFTPSSNDSPNLLKYYNFIKNIKGEK